MSDTDSIKTDRSQSDLQQKYDRLAMEFAKARMQLNVLKKAYTNKMSKLDHRSVESIDQLESCKYDTMSTISFDFQENVNRPNQLKRTEEFSSKDLQVLKQDIATMNHFICRVLELTQSNQIDYSLIMSEIEYCKDVQNNCSGGFCEIIDNEFTTLKSSVLDCLYNILYHKLESRTKINTDDSRLIYPDFYFLDTNYKTEDEIFQKVFITLVFHYFLSFILNLHEVLEYLLKEINPDASHILKSSLKLLKNPQSSQSLLLENILLYCEDLRTLKFETRYIIMENILLFISNKYIESVECIQYFIKSGDKIQIDCTLFRQSIISLMAIKFPIKELVNIESEYWDSGHTNNKLLTVFDTIHRLLRVINIFEFEYFYKKSQLGIHWHKKNTLLHVKHSKQATEKLFSMSISQNKYDDIIQSYNEKLNQEMNRSLSLEQEKLHWENEYKLLCKKYDDITNKDNSGSLGPFLLENQMGKCESSKHFNDKIMTREKGLKCYFEKKINNLMSMNKDLSSQSNANVLEITALKTRLDHSILVRNELEMKLQNAMEHIEDLKEEFQLTSTNYDTQLRSMTEHLASLNETVVLERRHIDDLNVQLKTKGGKNKSSK
ncbi:Uncharacterised domain KLRAQ/TTKRSYEDQ, C-terminal [Cinara cedri]|uniref:Uncharacterized domain KLRAQ/TTKRSYEDQ, C-terminal n=1 Tax=Cinara cedri TaxID=506608 RepID=A0A5E4M307_9HEMI|nr:Uncharacterised domain KLRAQ/TTKRSYEDQ, C-terminal [Cinara cedri]